MFHDADLQRLEKAGSVWADVFADAGTPEGRTQALFELSNAYQGLSLFYKERRSETEVDHYFQLSVFCFRQYCVLHPCSKDI